MGAPGCLPGTFDVCDVVPEDEHVRVFSDSEPHTGIFPNSWALPTIALPVNARAKIVLISLLDNVCARIFTNLETTLTNSETQLNILDDTYVGIFPN